MSLRDKFVAAQHGQTAQDTFSDRRQERDSFELSLTAYYTSIEQLTKGAWRAQDLDRPRRNVLSFYGVGGVGKSSLLRKLEQTIGPNRQAPKHWPEIAAPFKTLVPINIDMGRSGISGIEPLLVSIRAALMEAGVSTPAFDIFLAAYWAEVHPNETLKDRVVSGSKLGQITDKLGLEAHVQSAIGDIASTVLGFGTLGTSTYEIIKLIIKKAKTYSLRNGAFKDCQMLDEILAEVDDSDALKLSAYLLAWDIEREQKRGSLGLAVFLDTVEEAASEDLDAIEQIIWLLPNVFFVLAGRNRLSWSERWTLSDRLPGAQGGWPGLANNAEAEPRQHLVGNLSPEDSHKFLSSSIPTAAIEVISAVKQASDGFPLHLDLSVQRFRQIEVLREVVPKDFEVSFEQLANRVVRDLSSQEQLALMACCLFDSFDEELVQVTAGLDVVGPVRELFKRSLLESGTDTFYGYSLHNVLRQALLNSNDMGMGQLSFSDWRQFAQRGVAELKLRRSTCSRSERRFIVSQLAAIMVTFETGMIEFQEVADRILANEEWHQNFRIGRLADLRRIDLDSHNLHHAIVLATSVVMTRQERPRAQVVWELKNLVKWHDGASELDFARYCLGESLRDIGEIHESESMMNLLAYGSGVWAKRALRGQIHLYRRAGRFRTIEEVLRSRVLEIPYRGRLMGDLYWTQCQLGKAFEHYSSAAVLAQNADNASEEALNIASMCFVDSWLDSSSISQYRERIETVLDGASHSFSNLMLMVAAVLASEDMVQARHSYDELVRVASAIESTSAIAYGELGLAFQGAVSNAPDVVEGAFRRVVDSSDGVQFVYIAWIIAQWLHSPSAESVQALEPQEWCDEDVLTRWRDLPSLRQEASRAESNGGE